ncbi:aldehyde dehydrogenase family protein, partial [Fodinicurvata halophila]
MSVNTPHPEATRIELGRDGKFPLLLAGRFLEGAAAEMEVVNPANGRGIGRAAFASQAQIDEAVRAGREAALAPDGWAARLPHERA